MTNIVDTSTETINAEFDAAEQEIGSEESLQNEQPSPEQAKLEEEQKLAEIAMATGMIGTSLRFAVGSFVGVNVDESVYTQAAESYAVLIIKYFPGGMFAFLDKFKEEFAAATATFVLIKVVSDAKTKQREEEEAKAKANSASKKTTFAPDQVNENSKQGEAHGEA